jgi:two-component system, cell cycle sensor histidine kinase and response regulator CckA
MGFVHPEDKEATNFAKQQPLERRALFLFENRYRHGDGSYHRISRNAFPVTKEERILAIASDIAEGRRAEEALRKAEERFRIAARCASDLIYEWDIIRNRLEWHGDIYEYLGYPPDESPRTRQAWEKIIHQDDRDRVMASVERHLKTCEPYCEEYRVYHKNGTVRYWTDRGAFLPDDLGIPCECIGAIADITNGKGQEKSLNDSTQMLGSTLATCPVGISLTVHRRMIWVNEAWLKMFGFEDQNECLEQTARILYPTEEEFERVGKILYKELETGVTTETAARFRRQDGSEFDGHIRLRAVDASDLGQGNISAITDLSELKNSQRAMQEGAHAYMSLAANIPGIVYRVYLDEPVRMEFFNNMLESITGFAADELKVGEISSIDCLMLADDRTEALNGVREALASDVPFELEYRIRHKSGEIRHLQEYGRPIRRSGLPSFVDGVIFDITDRKRSLEDVRKSEEKYRRLFEDSPDGIFITAMDGILIDANRSFLDLFGYTREEIIGASVLKAYVKPEDRIRYVRNIEKAGSVRDYPLQLRKKDGTEMDCLISGSVRRAEDGTILGYRGIIRDITEHNSMQRQLEQAQKMEAIGNLSSGIAHDFKNVLQVVMGYSGLLMEHKQETDHEYADLQKIVHTCKMGADLVEGLLTFSRKTDLKLRVSNLNRIVKLVGKILSRTMPKMVDVQLALAAPLGSAYVDPSQIEQLIINLGVNARDAMPRGGRLTIGTEETILDEEYCRSHLGARPGKYVLLTVSDTGTGMDEQTLARIFEPFFTTKQASTGTGLGLAVCLGIVQQHGGYITCESEPGRGSKFRVYLPVMDQGHIIFSTQQGTPAKLKDGTETVLLVEDEDFVREIGNRILTSHGYSVLTAKDGKEALELFREQQTKIALVVLDLSLPEMGGNQLFEEFLKINPQVRVLVASGYASANVIAEAGKLGAQGFVYKPFNIPELLHAVRQVLDSASEKATAFE